MCEIVTEQRRIGRINRFPKEVLTNRRKVECSGFQTRYHSTSVDCAHTDGVGQSVEKLKKKGEFVRPLLSWQSA